MHCDSHNKPIAALTRVRVPSHAHILNEDSTRALQPASVIEKLYPHQLTAIAKMTQIEQDRYTIQDMQVPPNHEISHFNSSLANNKIDVQTFIFSDPVGAGKTLSMLGFITHQPQAKLGRYTVRQHNIDCYIDLEPSHVCPANLIIVPANIVHQWTTEATKTQLKIISFATEQDINNCLLDQPNGPPILINPTSDMQYLICNKLLIDLNDKQRIVNVMSNANIILATPDTFEKTNKLLKACGYYVFTRVILDDLNQINSKYLIGSFNWIISSTTIKIDNSYNCDNSKLEYSIFRNDVDYIDKSTQLPKPQSFVINTSIARIISKISEHIPSNVISLINGGDMKEAIKKLNCGISTQETIIEIITRQNKDKLDRAIKERQFYEAVETDPNIRQLKIAQATNEINYLQDTINYINTKITETLQDDCFICMDKYDTPVLVDCCNAIFCLKCLMETLKRKNSCAMCRSPVDLKKITHITESCSSDSNLKPTSHDSIVFTDNTKTTAMKHLLSYIFTIEPEARVIVCSDHDESFNNLDTTCCKSSKLQGNSDQIVDTLERFKRGDFNVLFLNSKEYGKGLNIQFANYVILYHAMDVATEVQVIGRAQRPVRTTPLKIIYLRDTNEAKVQGASEINSTDDLNALG